MKDIEINIKIRLKMESELNEVERDLVEKAKQATFRSYAPYSNFSVGACLMLENGKTITGSNQENCAYPSGLCAERTTLFYANSRFPDLSVDYIAIAAMVNSQKCLFRLVGLAGKYSLKCFIGRVNLLKYYCMGLREHISWIRRWT